MVIARAPWHARAPAYSTAALAVTEPHPLQSRTTKCSMAMQSCPHILKHAEHWAPDSDNDVEQQGNLRDESDLASLLSQNFDHSPWPHLFLASGNPTFEGPQVVELSDSHPGSRVVLFLFMIYSDRDLHLTSFQSDSLRTWLPHLDAPCQVPDLNRTPVVLKAACGLGFGGGCWLLGLFYQHVRPLLFVK